MTRFDWTGFAFVIPDQKLRLAFDDPSLSPDILKQLVSAERGAKGTKAKISIGGWICSRELLLFECHPSFLPRS